MDATGTTVVDSAKPGDQQQEDRRAHAPNASTRRYGVPADARARFDVRRKAGLLPGILRVPAMDRESRESFLRPFIRSGLAGEVDTLLRELEREDAEAAAASADEHPLLAAMFREAATIWGEVRHSLTVPWPSTPVQERIGRPTAAHATHDDDGTVLFWSRRLGRVVSSDEARTFGAALRDFVGLLREWRSETGPRAAHTAPQESHPHEAEGVLGERVLAWLHEARDQGLTRTELRDRTGKRVGIAAELDLALQHLASSGRIVERRVPTRGRPRIVWVLKRGEG